MTGDPLVVILAGGRGSRIGGRKPVIALGGRRLIDLALDRAHHWSDAVAVAVREPAQLGAMGVREILDDPDVEGPLGGLIAALRCARDVRRERMLSIPADMPFLPDDLPRRLEARIGGHSCAIASSGGRLHPVCGLWRTAALEEAETYAAAGQRSLKGLAASLGHGEAEWPAGAADPFFNINTAADLDLAQRRARLRS